MVSLEWSTVIKGLIKYMKEIKMNSVLTNKAILEKMFMKKVSALLRFGPWM